MYFLLVHNSEKGDRICSHGVTYLERELALLKSYTDNQEIFGKFIRIRMNVNENY
jgi:hypothetical protein